MDTREFAGLAAVGPDAHGPAPARAVEPLPCAADATTPLERKRCNDPHVEPVSIPERRCHFRLMPRATSSTVTRRIRLAAGLAILTAVVASSFFLPTRRWALELAAWIRGAGAVGVAAYAGFYVVGTLLFFPGALLTLVAGFAYGPLWGTLIVWPTATAAATLAFVTGRFLARDWVEATAARHPRFKALDRAVGRRGFHMVLLLRLSPLFPFNFLNYTLGVTSMKFRDYLLASLLGMLPGTIMYVYLGSLITSATELASGRSSAGHAGSVLYWLGLAATVAVTLLLARLARRALRRDLDPGDGEEART